MRAWLFQANPGSYAIDGYLASREHITWTVRQAYFAPEMHAGDVVYLWRTLGRGESVDAGVVASGVLLGPSGVFEDDTDALRFGMDDVSGPALRVRIRLTKVATKRQILKREWMTQDPVLSDLAILNQPDLTNYLVNEKHTARLAKLWEKTGQDWDRSDSVAGLWAYDQTYDGPISKLPGSIVANVAVVIGRAVGGVYNKVLNFRYLDPRQGGKGLSGGGDSDKQVWREFFDSAAETIRSDALDDEFRRLWQSSPESPTRSDVVYAGFGEAPNDDPACWRSSRSAEI
jgi:hypothetical protein